MPNLCLLFDPPTKSVWFVFNLDAELDTLGGQVRIKRVLQNREKKKKKKREREMPKYNSEKNS